MKINHLICQIWYLRVFTSELGETKGSLYAKTQEEKDKDKETQISKQKN